MSKYQERERKKAVGLVRNSDLFERCRGGGKFLKKNRPFVLSNGNYNLFKQTRTRAITYFKENKISWWRGGENPTGHTLSSQIACLNHLFAIRDNEKEVLKIAQIICPDIVEVLKIETDDFSPAYISFEVVGDNDYLNECKEEQKLTRGSLFTSVDALIYAKDEKGKKYIFPIEWKYTEYYNNQNKATEGLKNDPIKNKGETRKKRYTDLINSSNQLKSKNHFCYYFEPFYQLMRQTLWAEQMIRYSEKISADDFIHVHVIPQENSDLLKKKYICSGQYMEITWRECLQDQSKYKIISPQDLLADIDNAELKNYLSKRYWNTRN